MNYASFLQKDGIGFFITDNNAEKINVVVPPIITKKISKLDFNEINNYFSEDSTIKRHIDDYEFRQGQLQMSYLSAEALNDDKIAIIEAGTGIGKTLAYLIPAFLWAIKNNERVVISTNTINLQSQLINKDIPLVKKILGSDLEPVLVKGRKNYICKLKIYNISNEFEFDEESKELNSIIKWSNTTNTGVLDELNFIPNNSNWEKISSDVDFCTGSICTFYKDCFFQKARRKMNESNILIVNHHILFADISIRSQGRGIDENSLLPSYRKIIFDEAHNIVKSASSFF
jgi:ATP-dependent DNA helicase DinG